MNGSVRASPAKRLKNASSGPNTMEGRRIVADGNAARRRSFLGAARRERHDLPHLALGLEEARPPRVRHRHTDRVARPREVAHHVAADEARAAEDGGDLA